MERRHYEADAGIWVAYRDEPNRRFPELRSLAFVWGKTASTTSATENIRYDTKREAEMASRAHWPYRISGYRTGGMRVEDAVRRVGEQQEAVRQRLAQGGDPDTETSASRAGQREMDAGLD